MKQIRRLEKLLYEQRKITVNQARQAGVKNVRQQVHFLRKEGLIIANPKPKVYEIYDR